MKHIFILLFLGFSVNAMAQQFSYKPVNPAFGGDTFNYNWLLSSATAQNGLTAPKDKQEEKSELSSFGESLSRQLLSQFSRTLLNSQIESIGNLKEEGVYKLGDLNVEVFESTEGLVINILDTSTGETTQVIVPN